MNTTKKKHLKSLRDYVEVLRKTGDLKEIKREVEANLEIGAIIRRSCEIYSPAPLFSNIKGYPGYRVLGAPLSYSSNELNRSSRVAIALGLDPSTKGPQIVQALADGAKNMRLIPPVVVENAPCQENIMLADDVDILKFPTPMIHDGDGGRYFGTLHIMVCRTPDGSWTNWSIARVMIIEDEPKKLVGILIPFQHNGIIFQKWKDIGKPMPFAIANGVEPAATFVGGMPLPENLCEGDYLGGWFGEPIEVVRCKTVDLEVPATAEIVVEGTISTTETHPEGTMGEFHGYINTLEKNTMPVFNISAITHRDNPILPVCSAGKPVEENHTIAGPALSAMALEELRNAEIPVKSVYVIPESALHLMAVTVSSDWPEVTGLLPEDFCRKIGHICKEFHGAYRFVRVLVTDDDIDLSDLRDIFWAWNSRCHPSKGHLTLSDEPIHPGEPLYAGHESLAAAKDDIEVLNCLLPRTEILMKMKSTAFADDFPKELQNRVIALWDE